MRYWNTFLVLLLMQFAFAQNEYTHQDTLRGTITPERLWWNVTHYDLSVEVDMDNRSINGSNEITFYPISAGQELMQIDLQEPMVLKKALLNGKKVKFKRDGNAYYINTKGETSQFKEQKLRLIYEGTPIVAIMPPWEGGFVWAKDPKGNQFVATANQGLGASSWWPCKDHPYDEVDSMDIHVTVPKPYMDVSNGRLVETIDNGKTNTYHWKVANPINNYGVNLNIAQYSSWTATYQGLDGPLDCSFYVLPDYKPQALKQFEQAFQMLEALEYWFGPYPFYEDGYKLVQVPYLGMEHQSSVTYGNEFKNGYLGTDLSGSGMGLLFDFIIVHESGHEWFANSITNKDPADMWIHEGFTSYSESLFLEYFYGEDTAAQYVIGTRDRVENNHTIIGDYGVYWDGDTDMYFKAANMLHTLRQWVNDDTLWRDCLLAMNKGFYHSVVTTGEVEAFLNAYLGLNLEAFFEQYLRDIRIPEFQYHTEGNTFTYKWSKVVEGFKMPVRVKINGTWMLLYPTELENEIVLDQPFFDIVVDKNFYITASRY